MKYSSFPNEHQGSLYFLFDIIIIILSRLLEIKSQVGKPQGITQW